MVGPDRRSSARRAFCSRSRSTKGEKPMLRWPLYRHASIVACHRTGKNAWSTPPRVSLRLSRRRGLRIVGERQSPRRSSQRNVNKIKAVRNTNQAPATMLYKNNNRIQDSTSVARLAGLIEGRRPPVYRSYLMTGQTRAPARAASPTTSWPLEIGSE